MTTPGRSHMTLLQQAEFIDYLVNRCAVQSGETAAETIMHLTADEVADLRYVADRLHGMAPHGNAIRRVVTRG
jgi:hypothetical protein